MVVCTLTRYGPSYRRGMVMKSHLVALEVNIQHLIFNIQYSIERRASHAYK